MMTATGFEAYAPIKPTAERIAAVKASRVVCMVCGGRFKTVADLCACVAPNEV